MSMTRAARLNATEARAAAIAVIAAERAGVATPIYCLPNPFDLSNAMLPREVAIRRLSCAMTNALRVSLVIMALLLLGACTDPDSVSGSSFTRGIDQDITVTHDAGAPTVRNLSLPDTSTWLFARGR